MMVSHRAIRASFFVPLDMGKATVLGVARGTYHGVYLEKQRGL